MFQKIYFYLNESKSKVRFFLISSNRATVETLKELYKEAKKDFNDLEEDDVNIEIFRDGVYKDYLYIFFDIAMPSKTTLEKYFEVKNFN